LSSAPAAGTEVTHGPLAHHFENMEQQAEANVLGMWVFLASEILFFGGLFAAYTIYRSTHESAFGAACQKLNAVIGATNTAVLLTSSLTMALAVHAARLGRRPQVQLYLAATFVLGSTFLVIKGYEWYTEYTEALVPRIRFDASEWQEKGAERAREVFAKSDPAWSSEPAPHRERMVRAFSDRFVASVQMFYVFYFIITGLHALHMVVGLVVIVALLVLAYRGRFGDPRDFIPVDVTGLYWHFVDIVWIFVFPILYLLRE
jgi:cytochrome c oxidase subunit III